MDRRRYLVAATAALGSVAGCSQMSEDTDGDGSTESTNPSTTAPPATTTPQNTAETPKKAVRSYLTAVFAGEVEAANLLIHPNGNIEAYSEDAAERMGTLDLTIQSLVVSEESETTATVHAVVAIENTESGEEL
mgnify:CR=1 FL=1